MSNERERLPFDPMQPVELSDGTPCEIVERIGYSRTYHWTVRIGHPSAQLCSGTTYNFTLTGGFSDGTDEGASCYPRLVNADPSVPPALRKARVAYNALTDAEKPDWLDEDWFQQYADLHFPMLVEENDVAMVSFFENERKLEADRRTTMRVGRYVRRFSGGKLKDEDVERVAAASDVKLRGNRVKFTQDAEEIEEVYLHGPRSCMSHSASAFCTDGIHPSRVYAGPDLAVAYLGESDDASARCVVWPEKKLYSTIYGDVSRMQRMLENLGFEEGCMDGARVRLIECDEGIVMPYVDGSEGGRVDYGNGVVVLGDGYDVDTSNTNGLGTEDTRVPCQSCDELVPEDDVSLVDVAEHCGEYWCPSCVDYHAVSTGHGLVSESAATEVHVDAAHTEYVANWRLDDYIEVTAGPSAGEMWHVDQTGMDDNDDVWVLSEMPEDVDEVEQEPTQADLERAGQMRLPLEQALTSAGERGYRVLRVGEGSTTYCTFSAVGTAGTRGTLEQATRLARLLVGGHGRQHSYVIEDRRGIWVEDFSTGRRLPVIGVEAFGTRRDLIRLRWSQDGRERAFIFDLRDGSCPGLRLRAEGLTWVNPLPDCDRVGVGPDLATAA